MADSPLSGVRILAIEQMQALPYATQLLSRFGADVVKRLDDGRVDLALAGYNAGENAVAHHSGVPPYRETREYIRRVLVARHGEGGIGPSFGGGFRGTPTGSLPRTAPIRVSSMNGMAVLSNTAVDLTERQAPLLGRVR